MALIVYLVPKLPHFHKVMAVKLNWQLLELQCVKFIIVNTNEEFS